MSDEPTQERPKMAQSVQPDRDVYGNLVLSVLLRKDGEVGREYETFEYALDWDRANMLYSNLHGLIRVMGEERMRNAATGDCATCQNMRFVYVEKNGRKDWLDKCPDCGSRYHAAAPAYPTAKEA